MTSPKVVELSDARGGQEPVVQPSSPNRWVRQRFKGIKPRTLSTTITHAEDGDIEDWADLANFMLRDPDVRAPYETRSNAIVGAEVEVIAAVGAHDSDQAAQLAQAGADFVAASFDSCPDFESVLTGLVHAEGVGWAVGQHRWQRRRGEWHSAPVIIEPREVQFDHDWVPQVRTYDKERTHTTGRWISTDDFPANTWLIHVPRKLDRPTVAGDLLAVAWQWLFKRWCELFRQEGLEKFASPFMTGVVPPNAPPNVRATMKAALENMSADQIAILEEGSSITLSEAAQRPGDAWSEAIERLARQIVIGLLGSELNTNNAGTGSRALGESQFATTTLPRLIAIAKRLGTTLSRDWAAPTLRLNAHRFGGQIPPTPTVRFKVVNEEPEKIDSDAIGAGLDATVDEQRSSYGLPPKPDGTGSRRVVPVAKTPPAAEAGLGRPFVSPETRTELAIQRALDAQRSFGSES